MWGGLSFENRISHLLRCGCPQEIPWRNHNHYTARKSGTPLSETSFLYVNSDLNRFADWLYANNCLDICMESTGKYWVPVFNILEQRGLRVVIANPKWVSAVKAKRMILKIPNRSVNFSVSAPLRAVYSRQEHPCSSGADPVPLQADLYEKKRKEPFSECFHHMQCGSRLRCVRYVREIRNRHHGLPDIRLSLFTFRSR